MSRAVLAHGDPEAEPRASLTPASVRLGWLSHALAGAGLTVFAWLAFGQAFRVLGHHGDSWRYMSVIEQTGAYGILEVQPSRLALPWAWAVGFAIGGADPAIYHLLELGFLLGSALCLYAILVLFFPGHAAFAFSVAVLSLLWPADPTRYDIATLGNRQALFFLMTGALSYFLAWRSRHERWLYVGVVLLTCSLLSYEAHLFLLGLLPLATLLDERRPSRRWLRFVVAASVPVLVFAVVNLATTLSGSESYRGRLWDPSPSHVGRQLVDGLRVLFVDTWRLPAELLQVGVVPETTTVWLAALLFVAWMLGLTWLDARAGGRLSGQHPGRPGWPLLALGLVGAPLALAVFAVSRVPMSQPDRTQTYALTIGAVVLCTALLLLVRRLPGGQLVYLAGCTVFVGLSVAMAMIYQRNFRDSWIEQRAVLTDITREAPSLDTGSLVVVSGLPDTRIVFVSGYTCDLALMELYKHPYPEASLYFGDPLDHEAIVNRSVSCGLLFNGRNLDPHTSVAFGPTGVAYARTLRLRYVFPYSRLVLFEYQPGTGTRLLTTIPPSLVPPGADTSGYNPCALIDPTELCARAR